MYGNKNAARAATFTLGQPYARMYGILRTRLPDNSDNERIKIRGEGHGTIIKLRRIAETYLRSVT